MPSSILRFARPGPVEAKVKRWAPAEIRGVASESLALAVLLVGVLAPLCMAQVVISSEATEPHELPRDLMPIELFRVGSESGPDEVLFTGPNMAVSNAPDGRLVVLDHEARVLRIFDETGAFVREVGRPGRGPGEFSYPSALAWSPAGELWIPEPFEFRYSVFDADGEFVRTQPRPGPPSVSRRVYLAYFDASGLLIDHFSEGAGPAFRRVDPSGEVVAELPPIASPRLPSQRPMFDRELAAAYQRHTRRLIWTVARDGSTWSSWSDELRLVQRSLEGDTLRIVQTQHRSARLTADERDWIQRLERQFDNVEFVPRVVQSIHASPDGHVYVQVSHGGQRFGDEVDVFEPGGEYVGTFRTPLPIHPPSQSDLSGGFFSFVGVDEYDVPVVVRMRLGH